MPWSKIAADAEIGILVSSDRGATSEDLVRTCRKFGATLTTQYSSHYFGNSFNYFGNSFNVLTALALEVMVGHSTLHLVEDDTILHPGYFEWARRCSRPDGTPQSAVMSAISKTPGTRRPARRGER